MTARCPALPLAFLVTLSPAIQDGAAPRVDAARRFLTTQFQLGADDFKALDRRSTVTRTLSTEDGREVATLGVIRIGAPPAFYLDQLRDIVAFKGAGAAVLQIGAFSNPARLNDVAGLSIDERDLESLRKCRPGDCQLQLSAEALERFRRDTEWNRTRTKGAAERILRAIFVDLVNGYRARGDEALMTYIDDARPLSLSREFRSMVAAKPAILERFPNLYQHVLNFPRRSAESIDDIVYWSKEKVGPTVVTSVTHLSIARLVSGPDGAYAAASRQLYGTHYFDSSLGITLLLDATGGDGPATLLAYVNRSRLDVLGGFFGGLKRTIVRSRTRSAMNDSLVKARDLVERRFRNQPAIAQ